MQFMQIAFGNCAGGKKKSKQYVQKPTNKVK